MTSAKRSSDCTYCRKPSSEIRLTSRIEPPNNAAVCARAPSSTRNTKPSAPGVWPGISTGVMSTPPNEIGSPSATTTSRRGGGNPPQRRGRGSGRRRRRIFDELPIGGRQRDACAALLEIRRAAEMIRVAVADEHVAHVVGIEARRAQLRQQHRFELVGIAGVDQ